MQTEAPSAPSVENRSSGAEATLTMMELAGLVRAHHRVIARLVQLELIVPQAREPELCFAATEVPKVRRILRLHRQMGIGLSSMAVVLDLLEQLAALEDLVARLRAQAAADPR